ncbi:MAG: DUF4382 domain-containing protein [Nitrososphaeria archaeon]
MSTKRNVLISGGLALVITLSLIAAISMTGFTPYVTTTPTTTSPSTTSTSTISTTYSTYTSTTTITTTVTTQPTTTTTVPKGGVLSILLTDPPTLPEGITAVYITYSGLAVHAAESNQTHGWIEVGGEGTVDLLGLIDVSQTISSVNMESGKYNLLRFNITSSRVVFDGKEYPAVVRTGNITVPIIGGIEVKDDEPSATIIDIYPTVFNIGSKLEPEFVISAVARAYPVPEGESEEIHHIGFRMSLGNREWWRRLRERFTSEIGITSASLSSNSLAITVKNTGNVSVNLKLVIISQLTTMPKIWNTTFETPVFYEAAVFWVSEDGSLEPIMLVHNRTKTENKAQIVFSGRGYNLTVGQQIELAYNGEIVFGFGLPIGGAPFKPTNVVSGTKYLITVIGDGALARATVVAS